jgi:uncharacterized protein (DUF1501 family)
VAGLRAPEVPLAFLSYGGYSATADLVALSRVADNNQLFTLTGADSIANDPNRPYHAVDARTRIDAALTARHARELAGHHLPHGRHAMSSLEGARLSSAALARLDEYLPDDAGGRSLAAQVKVALAACKAGLCVAANLSFGGFDTHDDNDAKQTARMTELLAGLDLAMTTAEDLGLRERLVIVVGSDFGRTPVYNDDNGKDHWSYGSMLLMGRGITGNRVIGGTDAEQKALTLDPVTLEPSTAADAIKLRPEHVHLALRANAGVLDEGEAAFPLRTETLPILG